MASSGEQRQRRVPADAADPRGVVDSPGAVEPGDVHEAAMQLVALLRGLAARSTRTAIAACGGVSPNTVTNYLAEPVLGRVRRGQPEIFRRVLDGLGADVHDREKAWALFERTRPVRPGAPRISTRRGAVEASFGATDAEAGLGGLAVGSGSGSGSWLMAGVDARGHFEKRAWGLHGTRRLPGSDRRSTVHEVGDAVAEDGSDLFRGRVAALEAAREWMLAPEPPRVPLVITGAPGAGKSSVLARTVLVDLEEAGYGPGLAFHARGAFHTELLAALAQLAGLRSDVRGPAGTTLDAVLDALRKPPARLVPHPGAEPGIEPATERSTDHSHLHGNEQGGMGRWLVAVDALDEVSDDPGLLARTLREVATLDTVRLLVATRRRVVTHPTPSTERAGGMLGELAADADSLIDLDAPRFFMSSDLVDTVARLLIQPSKAGRAWERYRDDLGLRQRLARVVADRATAHSATAQQGAEIPATAQEAAMEGTAGNFLVATIAADRLAWQLKELDPDDPDFDPAEIPSTLGDALDSWIASLPEEQRYPSRGRLVALAYARGHGLDDPLWRAFAETLGYPSTQSDLDALRDSPAADFLLETSWSPAGGRRVTRLFHQALVDQLLIGREFARDQRSDHLALSRLLQPLSTDHDALAASYVRLHLAEHAHAGGRFRDLLEDPDYVLRADLVRLRSFLREPGICSAPSARVLYRAVGRAAALGPAERAQVLALAAAELGYDKWRSLWSHRCPVWPLWAHNRNDDHEELVGHTGPVNALAFGKLPDGSSVLATGGADRTIRLWDPGTATELERLIGHEGGVQSMAFNQPLDGPPLLAVGDDAGTVRLWHLTTERTVQVVTRQRVQYIGRGNRGGGEVMSVAFGRLPGGTPLLATASSESGSVRLWDPVVGVEIGAGPDRPRGTSVLSGNTVTAAVFALAFGELREGSAVLAAAGAPTVSLWDPAIGTTSLRSLAGRHTDFVAAVATGRLSDGTPVLATGSEDATVRLWDLSTGMALHVLDRHTAGVRAVAFGYLPDGSSMLASCGADRTVRLWDPESGAPTAVFSGHTGWAEALAFGQLDDGRTLLASAGGEGAVRLWDVSTPRHGKGRVSRPLAVAIGPASSPSPSIASGTTDGTVQIVEPATGTVLNTLAGHNGWVEAVAFGRLPDNRTLLAAGAHRDRAVRIYDPLTCKVLITLDGHAGVSALAFGHLTDGSTVIATASGDNTVRLWDAATGYFRLEFQGQVVGTIKAVAFGQLADRRTVLATAAHAAGGESPVKLWDPITGTNLDTLAGLHRWIDALSFWRQSRERTLLALAGADGATQLRDAATGAVLRVLAGHTAWVRVVSFGQLPGGRVLLATAGSDETVRLWNPATGDELGTIRLFGTVRDLTFSGDRLVIASDAGLCNFSLAAMRARTPQCPAIGWP